MPDPSSTTSVQISNRRCGYLPTQTADEPRREDCNQKFSTWSSLWVPVIRSWPLTSTYAYCS